MLADQLDDLIAQFPDCQIAAYADVRTGISILVRSTGNVPRETVDELCTDAVVHLGKPDAPAIGGTPTPVVVKMVAGATFVYMRADSQPDDALLFMCTPTIPLDTFLPAARACLDREDTAT